MMLLGATYLMFREETERTKHFGSEQEEGSSDARDTSGLATSMEVRRRRPHLFLISKHKWHCLDSTARARHLKCHDEPR